MSQGQINCKCIKLQFAIFCTNCNVATVNSLNIEHFGTMLYYPLCGSVFYWNVMGTFKLDNEI